MRKFFRKILARIYIELWSAYHPSWQDDFVTKRLLDISGQLVSVRRKLCNLGEHSYSGWSSHDCANVADTNAMIARGEKPYRFRGCDHCGAEMPESKIYTDGTKEKNAIEYKKL